MTAGAAGGWGGVGCSCALLLGAPCDAEPGWFGRFTKLANNYRVWQTEALLTVNIDLDTVEATRARIPIFADRRPELY